MIEYKVTPLSVTGSEAFGEASVDELRILIALVEKDGHAESLEALAKAARVSKPRAKSALVFWQEAGVIAPDDGNPTITEEFEERLRKGEITEEDSTDVAISIRNEGLSDMINECTAIMKRTSLNTSEIKKLCSLVSQYSLTEEYILVLAAYMAKDSKLTVTKLTNKAISLSEKEIDTVEMLEAYISENEGTSEAEKAFRTIFGLWGNPLTKLEKECFRRWGHEYGYFTDIVDFAYNIAGDNKAKNRVSYADKLIRGWYEAGCRTLAECKAKYERDSEEIKEEKKNKKGSKKKPDDTYGAFGDPDEELKRALERSFGAFSFDDGDAKP